MWSRRISSPDIDRAVRTEKDVLAAMVAVTQHYFAACAKGVDLPRSILARTAPGGWLGWERWRGKSTRSNFGGKYFTRCTLAAAMDAGLIARQPIEPIARCCSVPQTDSCRRLRRPARDIAKAGGEYSRAFKSMIEALRLR